MILALHFDGTTAHPLIVRAQAVNTYAFSMVKSSVLSSLTPHLLLRGFYIEKS